MVAVCVETVEYGLDFHNTIVMLLLLECGGGDGNIVSSGVMGYGMSC